MAADWRIAAWFAMLRGMIATFEVPTLRTERLTLRAFAPADLDALAAMQANPEVRRFLGGNLLSRAETWSLMERTLGQWALRGYGLFAVEAEQRCAGWTGVLHPLEWPEPELAYSLDQPYWGRGIATEAVRAARDWAFSRFGFPRLASFIVPNNTRSARVAEKLGAVRDGTTTIRGFAVDWWVHRK
jgi:RimJ/RimL family protein N-acetyltransferase